MYKCSIRSVMAIIMAMLIVITYLPATAHAEDSSDIDLNRYGKITVNDYDDLYLAAKKELTKNYGIYNSAAYKAGHQIADQYNDEHSSVAIDVISTENPISITKEYIDSLIAKWYVKGIFCDGFLPDDEPINNEAFLQYLADIDYDNIFYVGALTAYITSSSQTVTTTADDPDGIPIYGPQASNVTQIEQISAEITSEETSSVTTAAADEANHKEDAAEETGAPETATEPSSINEVPESTEDPGNSSDSGNAVRAGTPGVLMSAITGEKKLLDGVVDHYEKTITVYSGTVYVDFSFDLNSIGSDPINAIIDENGNDENFGKAIWDKIYELQYYLDVNYATDTSCKTILDIAKEEANYYKTNNLSGIREEYGYYFNVSDKTAEDNWSWLFLEYCAVISRLTDIRMFPHRLNGMDPNNWVSFFSSDSKGKIYGIEEAGSVPGIDQLYIPQKGDLVVYDDMSDPDKKYDQIGIVTSYESRTDTISTIEVRKNKVVELTEIPRVEYRDGIDLHPVCYFHPNYTSEELKYTWPLPEEFTQITSYFQGDNAWRQSKGYALHTGIDIYCPAGTPVMAVSDGTVVRKAYDDECGNFLIIEHSGIYSEYQHLDSYEHGIEEGSKVSMGDVVAYSVSTGSGVTEPHLHYGLCTGYQDLWAEGRAETSGYINFFDVDALTGYFKLDGDRDMVNAAITQMGNICGMPYWEYIGFSSKVEWCADQCGYIDKGLFINTASPPDQVEFFRNEGHWMDGSGTPYPGMIIFFDKDQTDFADHVGIVEYVEDGYVHTIEGNLDDSVQRSSYLLGDSLIQGYGWILDN